MNTFPRRLFVATVLLGLFLTAMFIAPNGFFPYGDLPDPETLLALEDVSDPPEFKAIEQVKERKQAFFNYFRPLVASKNERIERLRDSLIRIKEQETPLSGAQKRWLKQLAVHYRLEEGLENQELIESLLRRADAIPEGLVLAQAAIESAWGTSRFAREGNNYFGQWCYSEGCGLVPNARNTGARHEVRLFDDAAESVDAYFRNVNTHRAYRALRKKRASIRHRDGHLSACALAEGLSSYSERGKDYVNEVKVMIRGNGLQTEGKSDCIRKDA